jgi:hypothetical protein
MSFPYLRQVFESYHAEQISLTELSDHLGVKPSTALALESRDRRHGCMRRGEREIEEKLHACVLAGGFLDESQRLLRERR